MKQYDRSPASSARSAPERQHPPRWPTDPHCLDRRCADNVAAAVAIPLVCRCPRPLLQPPVCPYGPQISDTLGSLLMRLNTTIDYSPTYCHDFAPLDRHHLLVAPRHSAPSHTQTMQYHHRCRQAGHWHRWLAAVVPSRAGRKIRQHVYARQC